MCDDAPVSIGHSGGRLHDFLFCSFVRAAVSTTDSSDELEEHVSEDDEDSSTFVPTNPRDFLELFFLEST